MKHEVTSLNTKKMLAASLKKIMEKKSFSKITISEIIADCGMNRKTFYYHFEDIYTLLKWMLEQEAVEVVKQFDLLTDYEDAILFVMDYVEENKHILNCAFDTMGHEGLKHFFSSDFTGIIRSLINTMENEYKLHIADDFKDFLCTIYVETISGVLINWVKDRKKYDQKKILEYISIIRASLIEVLKNSLREGKSKVVMTSSI